MLFSIFHVSFVSIRFRNDINATSVGTRAAFVLAKMPPRRRPANEVPVEEVYDRDRMTRLEQQVEALTQQLGAFMAIHNQQNQRPYDLGDEDP